MNKPDYEVIDIFCNLHEEPNFWTIRAYPRVDLEVDDPEPLDNDMDITNEPDDGDEWGHDHAVYQAELMAESFLKDKKTNKVVIMVNGNEHKTLTG